MAKKTTDRKSKPRSKVKQISKPAAELTAEQAKKVKGGTLLIAKQIALRDR